MKLNKSDPAAAFKPHFRERFPWIGGDLQTLRNWLLSPVKDLDLKTRLFLKMRDGDTLTARLDEPATSIVRPLIVLIHGLTGSERSVNIVGSAHFLVQQGWRVLRLNLRGSAPTRPGARGHYHAGKTEDLVDALRNIPAELSRAGIILIGHSLGGNLILKFLGEEHGGMNILCGVAVSSPLNLSSTCTQMMRMRNVFYQRYILNAMKQEALAKDAKLTDSQKFAIISSRTLYDFDNNFIAPKFGYRDALHYYAMNSCENFLEKITLPTLIIHALDDPWISPESYLEKDWKKFPSIETAISHKGGHLGFHGQGHTASWHNLVLNDWLNNQFFTQTVACANLN